MSLVHRLNADSQKGHTRARSPSTAKKPRQSGERAGGIECSGFDAMGVSARTRSGPVRALQVWFRVRQLTSRRTGVPDARSAAPDYGCFLGVLLDPFAVQMLQGVGIGGPGLRIGGTPAGGDDARTSAGSAGVTYSAHGFIVKGLCMPGRGGGGQRGGGMGRRGGMGRGGAGRGGRNQMRRAGRRRRRRRMLLVGGLVAFGARPS